MKLVKIIFFILILGLINFVNSQDNSWGKPNFAPQFDQEIVDFSKIGNTDLSNPQGYVQERFISFEEQKLLAEQRAAKISGNSQRVYELDLMLDKVRGTTITKTGSSDGAIITKGERAPFIGGGDVNTTMIFSGSVKGFATATEQVGSNSGRVWVFITRDTSAGIPDRGGLYYSDNGGQSWTNYLGLTLGGTDKFRPNQTDIEIIEGTSGAKYMWVVYTYAVGGSATNFKAGLMGVNITTFAAGVIGMAWPGNDAAKRYYRPRISSDNASWAPASCWVFIVCSFDSTAGSGWDNAQKYAEIHSATNVTTPTVTYKGPIFSWYMGGVSDNYRRDLHSDVAYHRNGGSDSVVVTFSNIRDSNRIFLAASAEGSFTINSATRTGTNANNHQQYTYIFSPGNPSGNNMMIVTRRNFSNSGDWDVYYYRSTNGCIPGPTWTSGYVDGYASTTTVPGPADIYGKRGAIDYRVAYTYDNTALDSVKYTVYTGTWSVLRRISYIDSNPFDAAPKGGFRMGGGDDCFAVWANYSRTQTWSSRLCNTTVGINNNNNSVPHEFSLSQNYPNPFNPLTIINFGVPRNSFVKLTVYDISGKVVTTLVNDRVEAGYHSVSFDASNLASGVYLYEITADDFSSVKKMVLVK